MCFARRGSAGWPLIGMVCGLLLPGGCADPESPGGEGPAELDPGAMRALRIEPADALLQIADDQPVTQVYRAIATLADGSEREVTEQTTFSAEDYWIGTFRGNVFTSAATRGGKTTVEATVTGSGIEATTSVTVIYRRVLPTPGVAEDVGQRFDEGQPGGPARDPRLVYPADGVLVPPNLVDLEFQWLPGAGNDLFELALINEGTDIRIYLRCQPVAEGCGYVPSAEVWAVIVAAFGGIDAAKVRVRGTDEATFSAVGSSPYHRLAVAEEAIEGGLYYWNATPGTIVRYDFGQPDQQPVDFYTAQDAGAIFCVGCHALSRNGERIAVGLDMPAPAPLRVVEVATRTKLAEGAANFMAFSPDGARLITSDGNSLVLRDAATNAALSPNPLQAVGTMPDWSADGSRVVYAEPEEIMPIPAGTPGITGASLKLLAYDAEGDRWSAPLELVARGSANNYYPTFSPDGRFVVFNRAAGESYDAPDASLWIVRSEGGEPLELAAANGGARLANSWPKFSPFVQRYRGRSLMWVTFSSRRDYGLRLRGEGQAQIWMAAIDPDRNEVLSSDPSSPAFWLPFQDIKTGNHIAQWTERVVKKDCEVKGDCPTGEFCEGGYCERGVQ